jgi:hypothetical protein
MKNEILVRNNLVEVSTGKNKKPQVQLIGTLAANLAYYGYAPSQEVLSALLKLDDTFLKLWWTDLEPTLKKVTGDDKKMDKFVVYKNFPKEVLEMSQAQYWFNQICMYIGFPNDLFTEQEESRSQMFESVKLKTLHLAKENSLESIKQNLFKLPAKWTDEQLAHVLYMCSGDKNADGVVFKENLVALLVKLIEKNISVRLTSAMDVLRVAVGLSGGDISLKTNTKFKKFSRPERRQLLAILNNTSNLEEDVARDKNRWQKLLCRLHPGDYGYSNVCSVYNKLYNDDLTSFNSELDKHIKAGNKKALQLAKTRPGVFVRRLHELVNKFGDLAVTAFSSTLVVDKLSVIQLLKLEKYVETISLRSNLTIAPKGNWGKLRIVPNKKSFTKTQEKTLLRIIREALKRKLDEVKPVALDEQTKSIVLQTSDSELAPYGRGTRFPIPDNVKFIRSASYWQMKGYGNIWFDNGWNFFDDKWSSMGTCCWDHNHQKGSAFSGDPTNSKEMSGKACQMIDLYPEELLRQGVRYCVWNILCFSHKSFNDADDVFAALQWGEEKQTGKLFEPSRCQLAFQLKGDNMTKFIAYIDLEKMELVYMDANLRGEVSSARRNQDNLARVMPAFTEYLDTLPTVYDLFKNCHKSKRGTPIVYTDESLKINKKEAYVFRPANADNKFEQYNINKLLEL